MEEFKKILNNACVPSLPALFICIYIILAKSGTFSAEGGASACFAALSVISVALLIAVIKNNLIMKDDTPKQSFARTVLYAVLLAAMCAALLHNMPDQQKKARMPLKKQTFTGTVKRVLLRRYSREARIIFHQKGQDAEHPYIGVSFLNPDMRLMRGDAIEFNLCPKFIGGGGKKATPYEMSLLRKGISCFLYLNNKNCRVTTHGRPGIRDRFRHELSLRIDSIFGKNTASVVKALYFGNRNWLDKKTVATFRRAGVLHVLAASGLHVGIIASIPVLLLGLFKIHRNSILCITMGVLFGYLYITDMPVSLMRACVMFSVFTVQALIFADRNILNALFLAALAILIIFPDELFSPGFQLSFGATLGIILFYSMYRETLSFLPKFISGPASVTLAAQVIVIPVIIFHFHELNLISVLSNLVVVPLTAFLLGMSILSCTISLLSPAAAALCGSASDALYSILNILVKLLAGLHGHFALESIHPLLFISFIMLIAPLAYPRQNRRILSPLILASMIICWSILRPGPASAENSAVIFRRGNALALLHLNGREGTLIGEIYGHEMEESVMKAIRRKGLDNIRLMIPVPDFRNIRSYTHIAKKTVVPECRISTDFYLNRPLISFIGVLDRDAVPLRLEKFDPGAWNNGEKSLIGIDSPDNVKYIYSRLKSGEKAENFITIPVEYF